MELWLQLINAETEEELEMLEQTGVMHYGESGGKGGECHDKR